jgi:hypothetical protein
MTDQKIPDEKMPLFTNVSLHEPEVLQATDLDHGRLAVRLGRKTDRFHAVRADLFFGHDQVLDFVVDAVDALEGILPGFRNHVLERLVDTAIDEVEAAEGIAKCNTDGGQ